MRQKICSNTGHELIGTEQTAVVSFSSSPEQNNRKAMFDITFKEVDKLTRQAETRAHQLGPSWARQSPVALDCGQARVGDLILTIQLHYIMADHAMTCV